MSPQAESSGASSGEEDTLLRIRENFISDGLRWNMGGDRKLIHLWRKLQRTEEALRSTNQEINSLKQQRKEEMASIEEFVTNIRNLSSEKDALTHSLETENESLHSQIQQICQERDAFVQENKVIAQLLLKEGLQQYSSSSPSQPLQHLIEERTELKSRIEQLEGGEGGGGTGFPLVEVMAERDRYRAELEANQGGLQEMIEEVKEVKRQLISDNRSHEIEKRKLRDELECKYIGNGAIIPHYGYTPKAAGQHL